MKHLEQKILDILSATFGMSLRQVCGFLGTLQLQEVREELDRLCDDGLVTKEKEYLVEREMRLKKMSGVRRDGEAHYRWVYMKNG